MLSFQRLFPLLFAGLTIASITSLPLLAQQNNPNRAGIELTSTDRQQTQSDRRVALVIGNSRYTNITPLQNPTNDARDMAQTLQDLGFDRVIEIQDADLQQMESALDQFYQEIQQGGTGVFYYAGHGVQSNGENYLIPVDSPNLSAESDLRYKALPLSMVMGRFEEAENQVSIVILDACRNSPFRGWRRSVSAGLAVVQAAKGMFIAYATAPGDVAEDGTGRNGTFTEALLKHIRTPGLKVEELFKNVRADVQRSTNDDQVPWESTSLIGDFAFNPGDNPVASAPATTSRPTPQATPTPPPPAPRPTPTPTPPARSASAQQPVLEAGEGVDIEEMYARLEAFARAGQWQKADLQNSHLMSQVTERRRQMDHSYNFIESDEVDTFPCADFQRIGEIWSRYSNGKFGYAAQLRVARKLEDYRIDYPAGWAIDGRLISWSNLFFTTDGAPEGHLPAALQYFISVDAPATLEYWRLLKRADACDL